MRTKHVQTLVRVFATPTPSSLGWGEVEAMLRAYGATLAEGRGSRIRVELRGVRAVFHRPHPSKELDRGAVASLRRFMEHAGVTP
ncbi:MAG: type II toxin-antitoxin system HicA family toxin [Trueperaceae bacterium]|nr:type II toxin-antitoxin system HicA family toxin [Trueperaceae bacterium]